MPRRSMQVSRLGNGTHAPDDPPLTEEEEDAAEEEDSIDVPDPAEAFSRYEQFEALRQTLLDTLLYQVECMEFELPEVEREMAQEAIDDLVYDNVFCPWFKQHRTDAS